MWTFEVRTGKWYNPNGAIVVKGYAGGNCGKNPEGVNNPDLEDQPCIGPLPEGLYTFGTLINIDPDKTKWEKPHLGPHAIPLIPDPSNNMKGRSGFFIHGDTTPSGNASEGCIILNRPYRDAAAASPDQQVKVVADFTSDMV